MSSGGSYASAFAAGRAAAGDGPASGGHYSESSKADAILSREKYAQLTLERLKREKKLRDETKRRRRAMLRKKRQTAMAEEEMRKAALIRRNKKKEQYVKMLRTQLGKPSRGKTVDREAIAKTYVPACIRSSGCCSESRHLSKPT